MHCLAYTSSLPLQFQVCCKIASGGINYRTLQEEQKALPALQRSIWDSRYLDRCGGQFGIAGYVQKLDISAEKFSSGMVTYSIVLPGIIRLHSSVRCMVSIIIRLRLAEKLLNLL